MNFSSPQVFPGFMSFFHDISRFSRCTFIFPGFPGRVGTLFVSSLGSAISSLCVSSM